MPEASKRAYNTTPEVAQSRGRVAAACRDGRPAEEIADLRNQLEQEKIVAAARKVAARLPELDGARMTRVAQLLNAGFNAGQSRTAA